MATEFQPAPSAQSKVSQGFSTLYNRSMRRSRSLASIQKLAAEDARSQSTLGVHQEEPEEPQQRPKLKTSKTNILDGSESKGKKWLTPIVSSASVFSSKDNRSKEGLRTPSPPARPKPAPHLWEEGECPEITRVHSHKGSLAGLEMIGAPRDGSPLSMNPPNSSPFMSSSATMSPVTQSPRSRASPRGLRDRSFSYRRKPSVTDLAIEPMSTVQELSPIPSVSTAAATPESAGKTGEGKREPSLRDSLTPRAFRSDSKLSELGFRTPTATHISFRRSSLLLPGSLAPLLIPNSPKTPASPTNMTLLPATTYTGKSPRELPVELSASPIPSRRQVENWASPVEPPDDERPPEVPPKSPRTLNRAFPAPRPAAAAPPPVPALAPGHTENSPISTAENEIRSPTSTASHTASHTAQSSVTSISLSELPCSNSKVWSPQQINSPSAPSESSSAPAVVTSPLPWSMNAAEVASPRKPMHNQNNFSIDDTKSMNPLLNKASSTANLHQRNNSDSLINRGRPMLKRHDGHNQRSSSRNTQSGTTDGPVDHIPLGFSRASVIAALSHEELTQLRHNAELQATRYETLTGQSVDDLTKELSLLEDHCTTLRRTAFSLREGRRSLHDRLLSFLKAPTNAFVSREHIIKQEAALSELDANIDEWTSKLEAAQDRRARVQRKLLEHTASILSLRMPGSSNYNSEEQTPPRSPVTATETESPWEEPKSTITKQVAFQAPEPSTPSTKSQATPTLQDPPSTPQEAKLQMQKALMQKMQEQRLHGQRIHEQKVAEQKVLEHRAQQQKLHEQWKRQSQDRKEQQRQIEAIEKEQQALEEQRASRARHQEKERLERPNTPQPATPKPQPHQQQQQQQVKQDKPQELQQKKQERQQPENDYFEMKLTKEEEDMIMGDSPRASAESIRIYADSGVASLLASIEKEIDAMDRMRRA